MRFFIEKLFVYMNISFSYSFIDNTSKILYSFVTKPSCPHSLIRDKDLVTFPLTLIISFELAYLSKSSSGEPVFVQKYNRSENVLSGVSGTKK